MGANSNTLEISLLMKNECAQLKTLWTHTAITYLAYGKERVQFCGREH
ncbi:hypothetical protein SEA_AEGEUS_61 [Mycobacterium phage Aegeus]|nr:hypothetical protein SEA_BAUDELAIRE_61 [Mycobacterium phage Baudelaire]WKW86553.1 hypothetical protein SEA_AEGEUS_61 [Mycobacterium phage Aegeus]